MIFRGECFLRPGPSSERPITFEVRSRTADEDGSRASLRMDLTVAEVEDLIGDLKHALEWSRTGAWKPGPV